MKGELGVNDTLHALHTLFEVLFTLVRGLAPFSPFITESIYQQLLPYIPRDLLGEDTRSVHFLSYPNVKEALFDAVIERQVGRMQRVIELARVSRERRMVGLKTPLKSLIIIHKDPVYLNDIQSLEKYIIDELNVRNIILSSNEAKYNVQYSVSADWPVLGKKLRKDVQRVKKALPNLSSEEVSQYLHQKSITVDGIKLEDGDLIVKRGLRDNESSKNLETNTDNDVLIILDTEIYPELANEGLAREIINRLQRLRKKAGLQPTDDVKMEYVMVSDPDNIGLEKAFTDHTELIQKALRGTIDKSDDLDEANFSKKADDNIILQEEQEIQKATFLLRLLKLA